MGRRRRHFPSLKAAIGDLQQEVARVETWYSELSGEPSPASLEEHCRHLVDLAEDVLEAAREACGREPLSVARVAEQISGSVNPPDSRLNYTYTPPFSIEKTIRAYLQWRRGAGKLSRIRAD